MVSLKSGLALSFGAIVASLGLNGPARAAWTYYDVSARNTADAASPATPWIGVGNTDGTVGWRERIASGPGTPAHPAGSGTAYTGRTNASEVDANLLTTFTGLVPDQAYNVRVYTVFPTNTTSRQFAGFSANGGATIEFVENRPTVPGLPLVWVDASNGGVGADLGARGAGDTRAYALLTQTLTADNTGTATMLLRLLSTNPNDAGGGLQDRFNIDGYALEANVPEPTAVATLVGLGGLMLRKRRR